MTRHHAIDLAERLWGEDAVVSWRNQSPIMRSDPPKRQVGILKSDGACTWFGSGNTWEAAFSQALSEGPIVKDMGRAGK